MKHIQVLDAKLEHEFDAAHEDIKDIPDSQDPYYLQRFRQQRKRQKHRRALLALTQSQNQMSKEDKIIKVLDEYKAENARIYADKSKDGVARRRRRVMNMAGLSVGSQPGLNVVKVTESGRIDKDHVLRKYLKQMEMKRNLERQIHVTKVLSEIERKWQRDGSSRPQSPGMEGSPPLMYKGMRNGALGRWRHSIE